MLKVVLSLIVLFSSGCLIADSREKSTRTPKGTTNIEQLKKDVANVMVFESEEKDQKSEENVQDADDDSKSAESDSVEDQDEQDVQEAE